MKRAGGVRFVVPVEAHGVDEHGFFVPFFSFFSFSFLLFHLTSSRVSLSCVSADDFIDVRRSGSRTGDGVIIVSFVVCFVV